MRFAKSNRRCPISYYGYDLILCSAGHRSSFDVFNSPIGEFADEAVKCRCGMPYVWYSAVDQTNEPENGVYPGEVELVEEKPAVVKVCDLGHEHEIEEATYKIPENGGQKLKERHADTHADQR